MKFNVIRRGAYLFPAYPEDTDAIKQMRPDEVYRVEAKMPRNVKFHRKYFVLLNLVFDNLPEDFSISTPQGQTLHIRSVAELLWHIKMQLGWHEQRVTMGGRVTYEAKSISFGAMDEAEFNDFYDRSIDVILKYFLPQTKREELTEIIALSF